MLSISNPLRGTAAVAYYLNEESDEFQRRDDRPATFWMGEGAAMLGLRGQVEEEQLHCLFAGFATDGITKLVQNAGSERRVAGWDLTLSAPKEVSVLWAFGDESVKREIEKAHEKAVRATLARIEGTCELSRKGPAGIFREKAALVFAVVNHHTSRADDPHIHSHSIVANLAIRTDGKSGSIKTREVFRRKLELGRFYQFELGSHLKQSLKLPIEFTKSGFTFKGIPPKVLRLFSKRSTKLRALMDERNYKSAIAAKVAALATRAAKSLHWRNRLFPKWLGEAKELGWGPEDVAQLLEAARMEHEAQRVQELSASPFKDRRQSETSVVEKEPFKLIHTDWKPLAANAPSWSPVSKIAIPHLRFGKPGPHHKPRWGPTLWQYNTKLVTFRMQRRRLFPRAPRWSPISRMSAPVLRVMPNKDNPEWGKVHWEKDLGPKHKLVRQERRIFPKAPSWSFASKLRRPVTRVLHKRMCFEHDSEFSY